MPNNHPEVLKDCDPEPRLRLCRARDERKPRLPHVARVVRRAISRGLRCVASVFCATGFELVVRGTSFVARASSPWLAVFRERRSYSTDTSKSASLFIEQQKDRLGDCLYRWSTIDRCRVRHPWAGSPCHVIVLFFLCLAMLGPSVVQARADDEPPPNLLKPRPHGAPKGLAGVGLTGQQVNAAIDKGSEALWKWLLAQDLVNGASFGDRDEHVLCALALVNAGFHKKNAEFNKHLRQLLSTIEPQNIGTYRAGILCMLVEAYGDPAFIPKLREAAKYLLEAQGKRGTWTYTASIPDEIWQDKVWEKPLVAGQKPEAWKHLSPWEEGNDGDNSVTQYAILGLEAATRSAVRIDPETWKRALARARERQGKDGGWNYDDPVEGSGEAYGSMTCSGICALAICRARLGEKEPTVDAGIDHGLGWLDAHFSVEENPNGVGWLYYYLYSLERVGRILDTEFIGPHEWYPLGARFFIDNQREDGNWSGPGGEEDPRLATSFALLFLTRATESLYHPNKPKTGPGTLETATLAAGSRFYIILDASGSMIDVMDGKKKFDIARDAVRSLVNQLPPSAEVALRVYGHRKSSIEEGADEDTELKIPMGALDKDQFNAALDSLRARGRTPLALSLQATATDLAEIVAEHPVTVLLLTDGGEDTFNPRGNPIKAAEEFGKLKNITLHVVGFDINRPDWSQQLQHMAQLAHGKYWPASKSSELESTVRGAVLGVADEYTVLDVQSHVVARGHFGQPQSLPPGHYRLNTTVAGKQFSYDVTINPGEATSVTFDAAQPPSNPGAQPAPAGPRSAGPPIGKDSAKVCANCGAALKPGVKFCPNCGHKVE